MAARSDSQWRSTLPFTYIIDYGQTLARRSEHIEQAAQGPPYLLHLGTLTPFLSQLGPMGGYSVWDVDGTLNTAPPTAIRQKIEEVAEYVAELREAGVEVIIPYIGHGSIIGDHERRTGFWDFYDHWEDYREFGLGPKPPEDPIEWRQCMRRVFEGRYWNLVKDPFSRSQMEPGRCVYAYETCPNHPGWRAYIEGLVTVIARCGYDGIFVDVNTIQCYGECCQKGFKAYLRDRYTEDEREHLFGTSDVGELSLADQPLATYAERYGNRSLKEGEDGRGWEKNLWAETQVFWAHSMSDLHRMVREVGAKYREGFWVVANGGAMDTLSATVPRARAGLNAEIWAPHCDIVMFEEEIMDPGAAAEGVFLDHIFQFKFAMAGRFRAGMLSYNSSNPYAIELSMAECAAGGGGAFIQGGYDAPQVRRAYSDFYAARRTLYEGFETYSHVGVLFSFDEIYLGNVEHLRGVYRCKQVLSEDHILFDLISRRDLNADELSKYRALVLPNIMHLYPEEIAEIRRYVEGGGNLIVAGMLSLGGGVRGEAGLVELFRALESEEEGILRARYGRGTGVGGEDMDAFLPKDRIWQDELYEELRSAEDGLEGLRSMMARIYAHPRRQSSAEGSPLTEYLCEITGMHLPLISAGDGLGVRFSAYLRETGSRKSLVLHAVNYDVPLDLTRRRGEKSPSPFSVEDLPVALQVPQEWEIEGVWVFDPWAEGGVEIDSELEESTLRFALPELQIYKVIQVAATDPRRAISGEILRSCALQNDSA